MMNIHCDGKKCCELSNIRKGLSTSSPFGIKHTFLVQSNLFSVLPCLVSRESEKKYIVKYLSKSQSRKNLPSFLC